MYYYIRLQIAIAPSMVVCRRRDLPFRFINKMCITPLFCHLPISRFDAVRAAVVGDVRIPRGGESMNRYFLGIVRIATCQS